ncbi:aminoglycoside 6-adenylyltransferase [Brevibacillus laterosporus]|uniref:aminoglycoside 6-adenylyltransferase n=1 Tax=Brevibacillus laterosporus TaxID=1465 RepID=UPI002E20AA44|nr:aminoglycoside 6-adenylyltransferase [Brevibacillus laterosporus]
MRSEQEMLDMILGFAKNDERIRAVALEGSRTNPNVPKDMFQDFDISYLVTDMDSFIRDPKWIQVFGDRIILQTPEAMSMFPPELGRRFSYLMLFTDGNRIDLTLIPIHEAEEYCKEDKLLIILMDKDNALPEIPPPTDVDYWAKRPSAEFFADCCNEFWWVSTYVAKGLWRREILYAQDHLSLCVRPMLLTMLEWKVGVQTDFSVSVGKNGKYLEKYLSKQSWESLLSTYADGSYEGTWKALFTMGNLFRSTAKYVANHLHYKYPQEEDQRVTAFLKHVQTLPLHATNIY